MDDRIEREIHLRAPVERVWQVITEPRYVAQWFGQKAEIDLRPGGRPLGRGRRGCRGGDASRDGGRHLHCGGRGRAATAPRSAA